MLSRNGTRNSKSGQNISKLGTKKVKATNRFEGKVIKYHYFELEDFWYGNLPFFKDGKSQVQEFKILGLGLQYQGTRPQHVKFSTLKLKLSSQDIV